MVSDFVYKSGQIILAVLLVSFVLFKLSLSMGWIPDDFSPFGIVHSEYSAFKDRLAADAKDEDVSGKFSALILRNMERVEKLLGFSDAAPLPPPKTPEEAAARERDKLRCKQNSLNSFFMNTAEENKKSGCIK